MCGIDGGGISMPWNQSPTKLSGALTLWFGPNGSDTTGVGSSASPFRTPSKAYNYLVDNYDLNGYPVNIRANSSGEFNCSLSALGLPRGHSGITTQVTIQGAVPPDTGKPWSLDPETAKNYKWAPNAGEGAAVTAAYGAVLTVEGFIFDKQRAVTQGTEADRGTILVNVGSRSELWLGTIAFGYDCYPGAMINAQSGGRIQIRGNIGIFPPTASGQAVVISTASNTLQLSATPASSIFPLMPKVGVMGNGIPSNTWVESVIGTSAVVLSKTPTASSTGAVALTFTICTTSLVGIGDGSRLYHDTGGLNGRGYISLNGWPNFVFGMLFASDGGISWSGVQSFQRETWQSPITFSGSQGSNIATMSSTVGYGVGYSLWSDSLPPNTKISSMTGNQVTLTYPFYRNVSSEAVRVGHQPAATMGPKVSAWQLSNIITAGMQGLIPGTSPVTQESNSYGTISTGSRFD